MATNSILKDLFAQIIHSEEKVKERSAKFKQVNNEIGDFQARTTELREEIKSFQGNLVIKSQKIAEQELQSKWFSEKEKIFTGQKHDLEKQNLDLQTLLKKIQLDLENEREQFREESEQFCSMYDLISDGRKKREIGRKKKLEEMISFKEKLMTEIQVIKKERNEIGFLEDNKKKLLFQISELDAKHEGINNLIKTKKEETERMEVEKIKVSQKPQCDPEFQRISTELHTCKENSLSLEGICDEMRQELKELQQQCYQKQLQRQRKQRQEQKQQQQQQQNQQKQQQQPKKQQWPKQQQQQTKQQQWQKQKHQTPQQQQQQQQQWQQQQQQQQLQRSQEKRAQRPLFDHNSQKNKQQIQDAVSNIDASTDASTSRNMQQHSRNVSFHY